MNTLAAVLEEATKRGASDVHLVPGRLASVRAGQRLAAIGATPVDAADLERQLDALLTPASRARLHEEGALELASVLGGSRFRASLSRTLSGVAASLRLLPPRAPSLADLGAPELLSRLAERASGLVFVTGPAGSGRSSTAAALLDRVNRSRACHVLTIESPVEIVHEPVLASFSQREVGASVPSFSAGLRDARRLDADVVFVSELPGADEIGLAVDLAASGALVIATLPANGAVAAVERLASAFPEPDRSRYAARIGELLVGVVAQQLVWTRDGKSRVAAFEVLLGTPATAVAIRDGKLGQLTTAMQAGQVMGLSTLDATLERLFVEGRVEPEIAFARAVDKEAFADTLVRLQPELASSFG